MEYDPLTIYHHPRLKKPVMLAAWPGVSNVALEVAGYLKEMLGAEPCAQIEPEDFFIPVGIRVTQNVAQIPVFPESTFYLAKTPKGKSDLIIFYCDAQPDQNHYDLAHTVLDAAERFKVKRIYTCASAMVQHSVEKSRVLVAATDSRLIREMKRYNVTLAGDFQIRGLNGLLLGAARERRMDGICLLGETPQYAAEIPNPIASYAVLQVLTKVLDLDIDLSPIAKEAEQMAQMMKALSQEMMVKYIDHFTQPIWERNPRDTNGDEEDEGENGEE